MRGRQDRGGRFLDHPLPVDPHDSSDLVEVVEVDSVDVGVEEDPVVGGTVGSEGLAEFGQGRMAGIVGQGRVTSCGPGWELSSIRA